MTDERLAEIEHDWQEACDGGALVHPNEGELLQALKAERQRIAKLEAALREIYKEANSSDASLSYIAKLASESGND